jgi:MacB-like periplasmic core domain
VRFNRVDVGFFDAFDVPILTGRRFEPGDVNPAASNVIVNRTFVERVLGGRNALGRRIRYVGRSGDARPDLVELGRWYEIVGVVSDFPPRATSMGLVNAKLYHAAASGDTAPVRLAVRGRGTTPAAFAGRLREIAATVDPNLQLRNVLGMDEVLSQEQGMARLLSLGLVILTLSVVAPSAAGIYALMSFTVAQRRKEIGIRAALGADPRRILGSIFSRALIQLATGALLGALVAALLEQLTNGDLMRGNGPVVLPAVAAFMMLVGLLAAIGPARRGLRIDPTEALRQE